MNFWESTSELKIDGTPENAFASQFQVIPDGTKAIAELVKVELDEWEGRKKYTFHWKLLDTAYKGNIVRHALKCFDTNPKARDRHVNMLLLIMKMANHKPVNKDAPTPEYLQQMRGLQVGLLIQEWWSEDGSKNGNWVSEVHPPQGFESYEGKKIESAPIATPKPVDELRQSATFANAQVNVDDDIPFN